MPLSDGLDDPSLPAQATRNPTGSPKWTLGVSCLSVAQVFGTSQAAMALSAITAVGSQIDTSTESSTP